MARYTTFAASLIMATVIVLLVGGGHLRTSLGAPICGDTAATDQATFTGYARALLDELVQKTTSVLPDYFTYYASIPKSEGSGSAIGAGTCYDQGDKTAEDCGKCLSELRPYLEECANNSSSAGAFYQGRCMIKFWEYVMVDRLP